MAPRITQTTAICLTGGVPEVRVTQTVVLAAAPTAKPTVITQTVALVLCSGVTATRITQTAALVLIGFADRVQSRQRAWTFTLDGHTFYALDMSEEGTFVYDTTTEQWCQFKTASYVQWNCANGGMWRNRIVGGDLTGNTVWEVTYDASTDMDSLDISHTAVGGLQTRDRKKVPVGAVRVMASVGKSNKDGAVFSLRFSDDRGNTWVGPYDLTLADGAYGTELAFRSLGAFAAPGRIFELTDVGGPVRIDGCDADI